MSRGGRRTELPANAHPYDRTLSVEADLDVLRFDERGLVPVIAQAPTSTGFGLGVDATRSGLLLTPGSLLMLVVGPLSGVIGNRLGNKFPLAAGSGLAAAGLALLAVNHGSQAAIMLLNALVFAGIGMAFAAMPNLIVDAVPATQTGEATGVNALIRSVGSSLGSTGAARSRVASWFTNTFMWVRTRPCSSTTRNRRPGNRRSRSSSTAPTESPEASTTFCWSV